ncbi:MAG: YlxR family protein [Deinococcota bacterium]
MTTPHASKQHQYVQRHVPLRRCVVCRKQRPQAELVRFYRDDTGQWQLDVTCKAGGRGAWLCALAEAGQPACTQASLKTLQRFFRGQAQRVYDILQTDALQTNTTGEGCQS